MLFRQEKKKCVACGEDVLKARAKFHSGNHEDARHSGKLVETDELKIKAFIDANSRIINTRDC